MVVFGFRVALFDKESLNCDFFCCFLFIYLFIVFYFCRFCMCDSPVYVQLQFYGQYSYWILLCIDMYSADSGG